MVVQMKADTGIEAGLSEAEKWFCNAGEVFALMLIGLW